MYVLGRSGTRRAVNIWPGFVDALATLLLVVIFVLMVFVIAQYFLSAALSGRDQALTRLQREVNNLAELLALERSANEELRVDVSQLSSELQSSLRARDSLAAQVAALTSKRDDLQARLNEAEVSATRLSQELENAYKLVDADKNKIEAQLTELAILQQAKDDLERRLQDAMAEAKKVGKDLEDAYKVVEADKEKIRLHLAEIATLKSLRDELLSKLQTTEDKSKQQAKLSDEAQAQVAILNQQVAALRQQLADLSATLDLIEAENKKKDVQIANLGRRLNLALASKVQELTRYRSEFFGRLREVLGDRKDVRIVGDRFVFQSEVLFASGSAELGEPGKRQLAQLADTLLKIAKKIPKDLPWILRVDGHTDRAPISTSEFASNWELSTARAISVVKFLIEQGIPPEHLAATGFGEYQPLDPGSSEEAFRRNRRIELKLDRR